MDPASPLGQRSLIAPVKDQGTGGLNILEIHRSTKRGRAEMKIATVQQASRDQSQGEHLINQIVLSVRSVHTSR